MCLKARSMFINTLYQAIRGYTGVWRRKFTNNWWLDMYGWRPTQIPFRYLEKQGWAWQSKQEISGCLPKGNSDFVGVSVSDLITYERNPAVVCPEENEWQAKGTNQETGMPGVQNEKNPHLTTSNWDWTIVELGCVSVFMNTSAISFSVYNREQFGWVIKLRTALYGWLSIDYLRSHLEQCRQAISDSVDLIGYYGWSFTDLLSWLNGYQKDTDLYVNRDGRKHTLI